MKTKLHYVLTTTMLLFIFSGFSQNSLFTKIDHPQYSQSFNPDKHSLEQGVLYQINYEELSKALNKSSKKIIFKLKSTINNYTQSKFLSCGLLTFKEPINKNNKNGNNK